MALPPDQRAALSPDEIAVRRQAIQGQTLLGAFDDFWNNTPTMPTMPTVPKPTTAIAPKKKKTIATGFYYGAPNPE